MRYADIARLVVDKLNRDNKPRNEYDRYKLEYWGGSRQAVIYHHGGRCTDSGWGMIAWTNANDAILDSEDSCCKMLRHYVKTKNKAFSFDSPEELEAGFVRIA